MKVKFVLSSVMTLCAWQGAHATEITYSLWDANQQPAYQKCADDFQQENKDIKVKIIQYAWPDYWEKLKAGLQAGKAPDVFTNHLSKYPEFAKKNQLVNLASFVRRDQVNTSIYLKGLYQAWGRDGRQYGLPKDWDTIAMIVNMDMAQKAHITLTELQTMNWNPHSGGSFEHVIAKLTKDVNGRDASDPKFDKTKVAVHGYQIAGLGGMAGQVEWSHFAVSNGFKFQDKAWDPKFYYDSPRLAETMTWLASLQQKGISASLEQVSKFGAADDMFIQGKVAMVANGSWTIKQFLDKTKFNAEWVPLPIGPVGNRASMFNGLADSIWVGSKYKEESWKWVKFLASEKCQATVADAGVVFPAINKVVTRALAAQYAKGARASAFLEMSMAKTFMAPIANNGYAVNDIMNKAFDTILKGKGDAQTILKEANEQAILAAKK
jgi:multiple sugar transport system substrate-binding protein